MKKLILPAFLLTFALTVQAGGDKCATAEKGKACCAATATASGKTDQPAGGCCKGSCSASKTTAKKQVALLSPKAAADAR